MARTVPEIESELRPLLARRGELDRAIAVLKKEMQKARSVAFISASAVTREDVQLSKGDGLPWFGTVWGFANWLAKQDNPKRWCEWNDRIYSTAEIIRGVMNPDAPGCIQDIPA